MPLLAILATNNQIKDAMRLHRDYFHGTVKTEAQKDILTSLLTMGFDDILTINYSYELEAAGLGKDIATDRDAGKMMRVTSQGEPRRDISFSNSDTSIQIVPDIKAQKRE